MSNTQPDIREQSAPAPHALSSLLEAADAIISAIIKAPQGRPVVILSGERHAMPDDVILPYALAIRASQLNLTSPSALAFGFETQHDLLTKRALTQMGNKANRDIAQQLAEENKQLVADVMLTTGRDAGKNSYAGTLAGLLFREHPVFPLDASKQSDGERLYIDTTDHLTAAFAASRTLSEPIRTDSKAGFAIRNELTAHLIKEKLGAHDVFWHQCGASHVLGEPGKFDYKDSLHAQFSPLAEAGEITLLTVMARDAWNSLSGLNGPTHLQCPTIIYQTSEAQRYPDSRGEREHASRIFNEIHRAANMPAQALTPLADEKPMTRASKNRANAFTAQVEKAARRLPKR